MKKILVLAAALMLQSAFADTSAYQTVRFTPGEEVESVFLSTEKTRTEYRSERVRSTCYRTVYRRYCGAGPSPYPGHGRICRNVPVQQAYPCTRIVRRAYEVFDHYVDSQIDFNFNMDDADEIGSQDFLVKVSGDDASLKLERPVRDVLVLASDRIVSQRRSSDVKTQQIVFDVKFVGRDRAGALQGGIQDVSLSDGVLSFTLGKGFNLKDYAQRLKVLRSRPVISDILLFDQILNFDQVEMSNRGERVELRVDLKRLGISLPSRMRIILESEYDLKGKTVLNEQFFNLRATSNWLFK